MSLDDRVFRELDPPSGGLVRLRERLARRQRPWALWVGIAATAAVLAVVWLSPSERAALPDDAALAALRGDPVAPLQVRSPGVVAEAVPTGTDDVLLYRVGRL